MSGPLLEYASQVWSPYTAAEIAKVESVQRSFTKRLPGLNNLTYAQRLCVLGIESLELRRLWNDTVFVYKILFGLVDMNFDEYFTFRADCATRGHEHKLSVNYSRLNIRKHFFTERVVAVSNNLENGVIKFSSLTCFKNSLLLCDLSKYVNF